MGAAGRAGGRQGHWVCRGDRRGGTTQVPGRLVSAAWRFFPGRPLRKPVLGDKDTQAKTQLLTG